MARKVFRSNASLEPAAERETDPLKVIDGRPAAAPGPEERALAGRGAKVVAGLRRRASWLRVAISAGLIYLILQQTSLAEIGVLLGQIFGHWPLLIVAAVLPGVGTLIAVFRWKVLLGGLGVRPATLALVNAMLVGAFFNYFLPSTIGGDVARSWWIQRTLGSTALSLTVIGLDRLIGGIGICAVGLIAAALQPSLVSGLPQIWVVALIIAVAALAVVALGHPRVTAAGRRVFSLPLLRVVRDKAAVAYDGLVSLRRSKARLWAAFMFSVALQVTIVVQFVVLSSAAEVDVSPWGLAILIPVVTLVTLIPVTINGIGLRETSLAVLGANFGLTAESAVALAWLFLAFQFAYVLVGGLIYMWGRPRAKSG